MVALALQGKLKAIQDGGRTNPDPDTWDGNPVNTVGSGTEAMGSVITQVPSRMVNKRSSSNEGLIAEAQVSRGTHTARGFAASIHARSQCVSGDLGSLNIHYSTTLL